MNKITITLFTFFLFFNLNLYSQTTLTHNIGNAVIQNSMYSCSWGGICWARKFVLSEFGIKSNQNFIINTGEVGLFYSINWDTNLQFNIYAVDSNFPSSFSESNLIGSSQIVKLPMSSNNTQIITVNFENPVIVPAGTQEILVEVFQLHSTNSEAHAFVAGTAEDNDFSWFRSKNGGCPPYNEYKTTLSLNRPDAKFYITVNGEAIDDTPFNITVNKDCNGLQKQFSLVNSLDIKSVVWNFGDINSNTENTSTLINPTHTFSSADQYEVTATFTDMLGQIYNRTKLINVKSSPIANKVGALSACESTYPSGTASFNTSDIQSELLGNQTGMTVSYFDANGNPFQSPLPNPLQSKTAIITARVAQADNLNCYSETTFNLIVNPLKIPIASSLQSFCNPINVDLDDISITGQNIKWYNSATSGILLPNTTALQNATTYYASQTINGCESLRIAVTISIQSTSAPAGNAKQIFCSAQNVTVANIVITGDQIKWYDALTNGNLLTETTNLIDGKTYYASQTVNGCESPRFGITVSIVNTPFAPTGNGTQQFCKSENVTLSGIQITGQNIKWYDTNFAAAALPSTTLLEDNRTYYASQTIGCEGDRTPFLIRVYDTPLPSGSTNQQFCIDEIATIENLNITGTAIKWYDAAINGNILPETTLLQNSIYYATQTLNNCESNRLAINVKIQDTQNPIADSPQTFCMQQNASIESINIQGQNIIWYENISSTINLSESTPLENGITYYASQTINNCESDRIPITIKIIEATNADCIHFVNEIPFPKFFTPNNDGYNDTWTIDFGYLLPNTGIKIFDRYGKFIKELSSNTSWDGTYLGTNEPASDYWFTVTRANGREYRGHFTLKR